jgi:hypothetical protein
MYIFQFDFEVFMTQPTMEDRTYVGVHKFAQDGSCFEVRKVSMTSIRPVSNSGLLFNNTLYKGHVK